MSLFDTGNINAKEMGTCNKLTYTATEAWMLRLRNLLVRGTEENPRGEKTKELIGQTMMVDMNYPVIHHPDRKLSYKFMAAEAEFIANGDNRVCSLARYNKNIAQFSDDGRIFNGNYGEPFNSQLEYVVRTLVLDSSSRQAVLAIWQENPVKSRDVRCTLTMQFLIRNNRLHTIVNMRSSDIMWGIAYDIFNFTVMTLRVLTRYNEDTKSKVELGILNLVAGSSHIYERHYDLADKILKSGMPSNLIEIKVPTEAFTEWNFIVSSLHACMEDKETTLWQINPKYFKGNN